MTDDEFREVTRYTDLGPDPYIPPDTWCFNSIEKHTDSVNPDNERSFKKKSYDWIWFTILIAFFILIVFRSCLAQ